MKKLLLFISTFALICCVSTQAQAQKSKLLRPSERERAVSLGISGTSNTTTIVESAGSYFLEYFFGPGYGVGLFVNVPFAERFSFQGEVQYDRFRTLNGHYTGGSSTIYTVSEAISVPLLIQWEFGKRRNMFLNFGPELRFNTRAFDKFYSKRESPSISQYDYPAIAPVTLAFAVGFGMRVPIAQKFDFLWELRLSSDLTSVSRDPEWVWGQGNRPDGFNDDENSRRLNIAIKAGLAYRF